MVELELSKSSHQKPVAFEVAKKVTGDCRDDASLR